MDKMEKAKEILTALSLHCQKMKISKEEEEQYRSDEVINQIKGRNAAYDEVIDYIEFLILIHGIKGD